MKLLISFVANNVENLLTFIFGIPALYFLGQEEGKKSRFGEYLKKVAMVVGSVVIGMSYLDFLWSQETQEQIILSQGASGPMLKIISSFIAILIAVLLAYFVKVKPKKLKENLKNHGKFLILSLILIILGVILSHLIHKTGDPASPPSTTVGEIISFGTYSPDKNSNSDPQTIEWIVLDVQGNNALLLSCKALDSKPYNDKYGKITWEDSSLCNWLNNEFINTAFTEQELSAILTTKTNQDDSDSVFLLSYEEVIKYFPNEEDRICEPTDYVSAMKDKTRAINDGNDYAVWWWLRSLTEDGTQASFVNFDGKCHENYVGNTYLSVRPALWLNLEAYNSLQTLE